MSSQFTRVTLSHELEHALRSRMTVRVCPKRARLYQQGTPAVGIYLVETGAVRVLLPAGENQSQLLEVVGAGAIPGLSESMSGDNYRVTAEAEETTTLAFIDRKNFLEFSGRPPRFLHAGDAAVKRKLAPAAITSSEESARTPDVRGDGR